MLYQLTQSGVGQVDLQTYVNIIRAALQCLPCCLALKFGKKKKTSQTTIEMIQNMALRYVYPGQN